MTPRFGTPALVQQGNSAYGTQRTPAAIDNTVFTDAFPTLAPPNVHLPRMPILEKLTPDRINAQQTITHRGAQARVQVIMRAKQARDVVAGYGRSLAMRRGIVPTGTSLTTATRIRPMGIRWG